MYKIISVTNRKQCSDFLGRVKEISNCGIEIILREKDLPEAEYEKLAAEVMKICSTVTLHTYINAAKRLGCKKIHLSMPIFREHYINLNEFDTIGVSVHSADEAAEAERLGASYVTAGHIFATDCKKGVPPRGLEFLRGVCEKVKIPVYAIGGINAENAKSAVGAGADGVCTMSALMNCADVRGFIESMSLWEQ